MKRHILVIDDDKNMRLALSEALSKSHYMVSLAGSGLEAIKKSKNNHIDVIICDVKSVSYTHLTLPTTPYV